MQKIILIYTILFSSMGYTMDGVYPLISVRDDGIKEIQINVYGSKNVVEDVLIGKCNDKKELFISIMEKGHLEYMSSTDCVIRRGNKKTFAKSILRFL